MRTSLSGIRILNCLLALALLPGLLAAEEPLRVGMDPRSAPWAFVPGEDYTSVDFHTEPSLTPAQVKKLVGIDPDVSQALADELGRALLIVPVSYFRLEQALLDGEIDLIVNAFNRTRETSEAIVVSEPYYRWGLLIAARTGDARIRSLTDLRGAHVGHFESQLVNRTLHSLGAGELTAYDNEERLFGDLEAGVLDAVVYDSPAVRWRARSNPAITVVGDLLNKLGYHVGMRAADEELVAEVAAALSTLDASGALAAIQKKWEAPED
jgi:polar amino acid transport system substrate-binding protein